MKERKITLLYEWLSRDDDANDGNNDIDLERFALNIHFKECAGWAQTRKSLMNWCSM